MLDNSNYNLMEEITQLSQSLARYDTYMHDAEQSGCSQCQSLWKDLRQRHEQDLDRLVQHLGEHFEHGEIESRESRAA